MNTKSLSAEDSELASSGGLSKQALIGDTANATQALLAEIVENSADSIIACTTAGTILTFNRGAEAIFGYSAQEVIGQHMSMLVHPERTADLENLVQALLQGDSFSQYEGLWQRKDGSEIHVSLTGFPIKDSAGEVTAIANILRDITERKRAEQVLRESEERFRALADSSPSLMWVTNSEGRIEFVNRALRDLCGATREEVEAGQWSLPLHPDDAADYRAAFDCAAKDHASFNAEARVRRADGEWRLVGTRAQPRFSPGGDYLGHTGLGADITDRVRAERAHQFQHSLLRTIHEVSLDGILVVDADGIVVSHNKRLLDVWQIQPSNISESPVGISDQPVLLAVLERVKDPEAFSARVRELYAHPAENDQCEITLKDGRTLERYSTSLRNDAGEHLARAWFFRDITERKRAEQAMLESENRFHIMADSCPIGIWVTDAQGVMLFMNRTYRRFFGDSSRELEQDSWQFVIHPEDAPAFLHSFAQTLNDQVSFKAECRCRRADGEWRWVETFADPRFSLEEEFLGLVGTSKDITERRQVEADLAQTREAAEAANRRLSAQHAILENERQMLRALIDNIPDLMWVKDAESRFVVANREVARFNGMEKPEDLLGKSDFDFFPPEIAAGFQEEEQRVIRSGQPMVDHEEISSDSVTGEIRYCLSTKVPLFDSEGRTTGIAGVGRVITERKKAENALRESNRQLHEATVRANELALEAASANQAKSEFLANMSHEIRTPMNGVLGMTGMLLGSDLGAEQRHWAEVVEVCAKSLLTVIDDILDFSKIEAGKLEIDIVDFNLRVLMEDFAEMMAGRIGEKPLEFVCAVAPDVSALLKGDPGRLRQVLLNLASNAIKFTHHGEVVILVTLIAESETDVSLRITVRDTGIGIPANKLQMLFTSFTQVDASTTRQYGGTGLGLAISKQLVELMGGSIGVESQEGVGSEFWFTIRLAKQDVEKQEDAPTVPVQDLRILVVDDNAANREVLTAQLQSWGADVTAVQDGPAALACLRDAIAAGKHFQLAVLDMMMPGMDGEMLGIKILGDEALKATPLVMMTSMGQRGDAQHFKEIGFAAYLLKPVRQSDLFDCLSGVLTGKGQDKSRSLVTRHSLREVRRSNVRILLAEDNLTNQEVASGMLKRLGWHADVACDGIQALQALSTHSYDLVLMDVQMPEMDGYEATRNIRDPNSPVLNHNIPIIATTAHAMAGDADRCLTAGMSDYISKPIDPKILAKVVEKWLTRKTHEATENELVQPAVGGKEPVKTASEAMVFNREIFLQRMMGDEEFAHDVADGFLEELPAMLGMLKEQIDRGDCELIWKQAHKMKGSAGNVGGEALRNVALEVEQAGKDGDLTEVARCIPELETQVARLNEALRQWEN